MNSLESDLDEQSILTFEMDYLPDFFKQKAVSELNETPETISRCFTDLKKLIKSNKTTKGIEFEDDFLRQFLRHSKYNTEKAFSHLRNFLTFKRKYHMYFMGIPEDYFTTKSSSKFMTVLPYRTPDGCTMILTEFGKWNPEEFTIDDLKNLALATFIQPLRDPMTQINGYKIIHDFKGSSIPHVRHCTPQNLHFQYHAAMHCIPARYKEIHFVNESILLTVLWAIVRNFISEKIRKRVFFHSKPEDLLNHFPPSVLPVQYGGDLTNYYKGDLMKEINREYGMCPLGGQPNYY